jgi:hypothetical protein
MPSTPASSTRHVAAPLRYSDVGHRQRHRVLTSVVAVIIAWVATGWTAVAPSMAPAGATPLLSLDAPIPLGPGIALTPADGWTFQQNQFGNYVELDNTGNTAKLEVTVGTGQSNDPARELEGNIAQFMQNNGFTNVNLAAPEPKPLNSRFFQQSVTRAFTADDSTPASAEHKGMFTELINTTTGMAAFAAFQASPDTYYIASNDATTMINSML